MMPVIFAGFADLAAVRSWAVVQDAIQPPRSPELGRDLAAGHVDTALVQVVRQPAVEHGDIPGGQPRRVPGIVQLPCQEFAHKLCGCSFRHLEPAKFNLRRAGVEAPDAVKYLLPPFCVPIGFPRRAADLDVPVFMDLAERKIAERIIKAALPRDDVLDIKLRMLAKKVPEWDWVPGIRANAAAFVPQQGLEHVVAARVRISFFLQDSPLRIFASLLVVAHAVSAGLAVLSGALEVSRQLDADFDGLAVLADDGIDHLAEFRQASGDRRVADLPRSPQPFG